MIRKNATWSSGLGLFGPYRLLFVAAPGDGRTPLRLGGSRFEASPHSSKRKRAALRLWNSIQHLNRFSPLKISYTPLDNSLRFMQYQCWDWNEELGTLHIPTNHRRFLESMAAA